MPDVRGPAREEGGAWAASSSKRQAFWQESPGSFLAIVNHNKLIIAALVRKVSPGPSSCAVLATRRRGCRRETCRKTQALLRGRATLRPGLLDRPRTKSFAKMGVCFPKSLKSQKSPAGLADSSSSADSPPPARATLPLSGPAPGPNCSSERVCQCFHYKMLSPFKNI